MRQKRSFAAHPAIYRKGTMRQNFTPQELADHFTLLPAEQALLANKRLSEN
jgi:hypothetical protein